MTRAMTAQLRLRGAEGRMNRLPNPSNVFGELVA